MNINSVSTISSVNLNLKSRLANQSTGLNVGTQVKDYASKSAKVAPMTQVSKTGLSNPPTAPDSEGRISLDDTWYRKGINKILLMSYEADVNLNNSYFNSDFGNRVDLDV